MDNRYDSTDKKILPREIEQELVLRSKKLIRLCASEIHERAEYAIYNLSFLDDCHQKVHNFSDVLSCLPEIGSHETVTGDFERQTRIRSAKPEIEELRNEVIGAIKDSLLGLKEIWCITHLILNATAPWSEKSVIDVPHLIKGIVLALKGKFPPKTTLYTSFSTHGPCASCYPSLLAPAIAEIILNSSNAISKRSLANDGGYRPRLCVSVESTEDLGSMKIEISDTATGIPEQIRDTIFAPYVSAWGRKGLGLYISRWIIEKKHGGSVSITQDAQGTTVVVALPVA